MIKNIVFSGAGIKIYSFLGSIKALEEHALLTNIEAYIGTSSGSLIATLLCIGFSYSEIEKILLKLNTNKLKNITTDNILRFFKTFGIDNANNIERVIRIIFKSKLNNENISFNDLYKITEKKLVITATCLNTMEIKYFDYINTPDIKIVEALLMSICVPILFTPRIFENKFYTDGGLISNYPIEYFKDNLKHTLGIMISSNFNEEHTINNITDYLYRIFLCPYKKMLKLIYEIYKDNTILIENNTNFLDFDIEYNKKITLIDEGYKKTKEFLNLKSTKEYYNFDF